MAKEYFTVATLRSGGRASRDPLRRLPWVRNPRPRPRSEPGMEDMTGTAGIQILSGKDVSIS